MVTMLLRLRVWRRIGGCLGAHGGCDALPCGIETRGLVLSLCVRRSHGSLRQIMRQSYACRYRVNEWWLRRERGQEDCTAYLTHAVQPFRTPPPNATSCYTARAQHPSAPYLSKSQLRLAWSIEEALRSIAHHTQRLDTATSTAMTSSPLRRSEGRRRLDFSMFIMQPVVPPTHVYVFPPAFGASKRSKAAHLSVCSQKQRRSKAKSYHHSSSTPPPPCAPGIIIAIHAQIRSSAQADEASPARRHSQAQSLAGYRWSGPQWRQ